MIFYFFWAFVVSVESGEGIGNHLLVLMNTRRKRNGR